MNCFLGLIRPTQMITSGQIRAARALLGIDQEMLASLARLSLPTIQRMEASGGTLQGMIESLTRVVEVLDRAGVELIGEGTVSSSGGRSVRLEQFAATAPPAEQASP